MDPEAQRIAIAKACGLDRIEPLRRMTRTGKFAEDGVRLVYCSSHHGGESEWEDVPDYLGSLDAMHEAFLSLKTTDKIRFHIHLEDIAKGKPDPKLGSDYDYKVSNATAAQRAEAFLRTLNLRINDAR